MSTITIECDNCGEKFDKPRNEYNRRKRLGKDKLYCSLTCAGRSKKNINHLIEQGKDYQFTGNENYTKLITEEDRIKSSLREFNNRTRRRKHYVKDLDIDKLYEIWKEQDGRCAYTNVKLVHMREDEYKNTSNNYKASLDRIDSSKPYTNDNVQFVSVSANHLKSDMSDGEVREFFEIIKNNS